MRGERGELSEKNPCHLPKYRYYELKNFCLQYRDWKNALILLDCWSTEPHDIPGILKGTPPSNPTERQALARLYYSSHIDILDHCIAELDPTLAPYILKGVTEGLGYDILRTKGCPCCREIYYEYYRYFFWLLSKERQ
jgi:hypothetical protein